MKKQKYTRAPEPENNLTYSQEVAQQQEPVENLNAEELSYKKRYQDIQRHIQNIRDQKDKEIADIKAQLDSATRKQIKFPKTDQEVDAWSKKYPDVAKIVDTIARKRANEVLAEGEKRLEQVEKFEKSLHRQSAEQELMKLHPDFAQIRQDRKFHDWVALQPTALQDSVYKNNTDAKWAARTIYLYKADTGKRKTSKSAAQAVNKASASTPPMQNKIQFSESMVQKMSDKEFEKNEEAITAAIQSGNFAYDISGAAR